MNWQSYWPPILAACITLLVAACGRESASGKTAVQFFPGFAATELLDKGIIVYSYRVIDGQVKSFHITDDSGPVQFDLPNGGVYKFFAIGAKSLAAPNASYADLTASYCGIGLNGTNEFFELNGTPIEVSFSLTNAKCRTLPAFLASYLKDGSGTPLPLWLVSCTTLTGVSGFSSGCTTGLMGSYRIEMLAFDPATDAAPKVAFTSKCLVNGTSNAFSMPYGSGNHAFGVRLVGFIGSTTCGTANGTQSYLMPLGLGQAGAKTAVYYNTSYLKVFVGD